MEIENLGYVEYDLTGPLERLGDHVVPKVLQVTFPGDAETPVWHMVLSVDDGSATCRELRIAAKDGARGVRPGDLAAVRLNDWIEDLFTVVAAKVDETSPGVYRISPPPDRRIAAEALREARRRGGRRTITEQRLAEVAKVYNAARRAPTQAVADHFNKSHRTASLYVAKARAMGLITDEEGLTSGKR